MFGSMGNIFEDIKGGSAELEEAARLVGEWIAISTEDMFKMVPKLGPKLHEMLKKLITQLLQMVAKLIQAMVVPIKVMIPG